MKKKKNRINLGNKTLRRKKAKLKNQLKMI